MSSTKATPLQWYKDNFLVSTSQSLLQPSVVNDAFASDYMYWARRISEDQMKKLLANSLCFGLYILPESTSEIAGRGTPTQIGLARLITDQVLFAYITDVFVIPEHQGKGLGKWLLQCVNETLYSWPDYRGSLLYTGGEKAIRFYKGVLGMKIFKPGKGFEGPLIMTNSGPGNVFPDEEGDPEFEERLRLANP